MPQTSRTARFALEYQLKSSGKWVPDVQAGAFATRTSADQAKGTRESRMKLPYRVIEL